MTRLKTAFSLFVLLCLFSFTPKDARQNSSINKGDKLDISSNELKNELQANKGHLVLINFWASYNASSRIENIKFANLMKNSKNEKLKNASGFALVSVSLDTYQSVFNETVKRDGLSFVQNVNATNGFKSKLAKTYKLGDNFGNLLLDAHGVVLAENITAEELKEVLQNQKTN